MHACSGHFGSSLVHLDFKTHPSRPLLLPMLGIFVIPGVQLPTAAKLFGRESRGDVAAEYALALRGAAIAIPFVLRIYPTTIVERQSWHALVILELARSTVIGMWNLTLV